jgi:hypothetical protein
MERGHVLEVEDKLEVSTAPRFPLRGHQLGYRPKVNAYDAFTVEMFEQYIRHLAIFGTNSIGWSRARECGCGSVVDEAENPHNRFLTRRFSEPRPCGSRLVRIGIR